MTDVENPFNSPYQQYQDNDPAPVPQTTSTETKDVESQQQTSSSYSNTSSEGLYAKMNMSAKIAGWVTIALFVVAIILSFCSLAPNNVAGFLILYILGVGLGIFALFFYFNHMRIIEMIKNNKINLIIGIIYAVILVLDLILGCVSRSIDVLIAILLIVLWVGNFYFFFRLLPSGISGFFSGLF